MYEDTKKNLKARCRKMQKDLLQAHSLFKTTLDVKMKYEEVLVALAKDPFTSARTLELINNGQGQQHQNQSFAQLPKFTTNSLKKVGAPTQTKKLRLSSQ